jgi:microcompartment protein CcmK/EutM
MSDDHYEAAVKAIDATNENLRLQSGSSYETAQTTATVAVARAVLALVDELREQRSAGSQD